MSARHSTNEDADTDLTSMDLRSSVMSLAIPAVARMVLQTVVGIVALMIVGRLNPASIAAVGLGNRLFFLAIGVLSAITVGTMAVVARAVGARDHKLAKEATVQSLLVAALIGIVVSIVGMLSAEPLMRMMMMLQEDVDMQVVELGAVYLRLLWAPMMLGNLLFAGNAALQGAGDMKTPMYIMGIVNLTNIGLAFLLVFGYGPIPALGVAGAGLAGGLSRGLGGILVVWFLFSEYSPIELEWEAGLLQIDGSIVRGILDIGLPAAGENLVRQASQLLYTMLIAGLGTMAIAANQIAMSVQSLSFMPGFGFGMAATALVGQNLGAQKPDRASSAGWESLKWAMLISCTMGVLFFFFPSVLMGFYTGNSEVIQLGTGPLQIIAFSQPFLASIMVLAGGLRGAGDTRYVMYLTTFGNWGIRLVFSYILGFVVGWGLLGVWVAMAMDQVIRGSLVALRFRSGKWKNIDVEVADSQPAESTASEASADSKSSQASLDQAAGRN